MATTKSTTPAAIPQCIDCHQPLTRFDTFLAQTRPKGIPSVPSTEGRCLVCGWLADRKKRDK